MGNHFAIQNYQHHNATTVLQELDKQVGMLQLLAIPVADDTGITDFPSMRETAQPGHHFKYSLGFQAQPHTVDGNWTPRMSFNIGLSSFKALHSLLQQIKAKHATFLAGRFSAQPVHAKAWSELRLGRHVDRMSYLVLRSQLEDTDGWGNDSFTSAGRAERLLLSAIEQDLETRGRASGSERQELLAVSAGYQAQVTDLHAQFLAIQAQLDTLKAESANAQYEALERHVGFKHTQVIRHRTQGTIGTLVRRHNGWRSRRTRICVYGSARWSRMSFAGANGS